MNHEQNIVRVISDLKADTAIIKPFKNYLISDAKRLQAMIRGARTMTNAKAPDGSRPDLIDNSAQQTIGRPPVNKTVRDEANGCICTPFMPPRKDCPVHGASVGAR